MARHGARAITSTCGTVDMAEALGVDVDCTADLVVQSIESANVGLFNGMSPHIHPMALGRILSRIHFGSTLNIAASLANPALPAVGVRGVYARNMIRPVAEVMKEIGYQNAIVLHGTLVDSTLGMDEASVCGPTLCAQISRNKEIEEFVIDPEKMGLSASDPMDLSPEPDIKKESRRFVRLLTNQESSARKDAAILNAGVIFLAAGKTKNLDNGVQLAAELLESGTAFETLEKWVQVQTENPGNSLARIHALADQPS